MIPEVILTFIDMLLLTDVFGDALEDSGDGNFSKVMLHFASRHQ